MNNDDILARKILIVIGLIIFLLCFIINSFSYSNSENLAFGGVQIQIYNENTILKKFNVDSMQKFISDLSLGQETVITEKPTKEPKYVIKGYNATALSFNKNEKEIIKISIYDDKEIVETTDLIYETHGNLIKNLDKKLDFTDLQIDIPDPVYGNLNVVRVAASQIGNVGGEPYWRWYGLNHRIEWCCVFVSWVGYQTGYLQAGEIPKFPNVSAGVAFYKNRGKWEGKYYIPSPGDVIFFDLMLDNRAYHVGLVEKVQNGRIYTIEGNYNDSVTRRSYPIGTPYIYGYGTPDYKVKLPDYLK